MGTAREYLGEFEQVVLLALARLDDGGYGAEIHGEILETSGRDELLPGVSEDISPVGALIRLPRSPSVDEHCRISLTLPNGHLVTTEATVVRRERAEGHGYRTAVEFPELVAVAAALEEASGGSG